MSAKVGPQNGSKAVHDDSGGRGTFELYEGTRLKESQPVSLLRGKAEA